jgi:hypothetical protein
MLSVQPRVKPCAFFYYFIRNRQDARCHVLDEPYTPEQQYEYLLRGPVRSNEMNRDNYNKIRGLICVFAENLFAAEKIAAKLYEQKAIPLSPTDFRVGPKLRYEFVSQLIHIILAQNDRTFKLFNEALKEFEPSWGYILDLPPSEVAAETERMEQRKWRPQDIEKERQQKESSVPRKRWLSTEPVSLPKKRTGGK